MMVTRLVERFEDFSDTLTVWSGSPVAFLLALGAIVAWACAGFVLGFTDALQLYINTGTTIVTFLMVFIIQAASNKSDAALHLKIDELLRAVKAARNDLIDAEHQSSETIKGQKDRIKKA